MFKICIFRNTQILNINQKYLSFQVEPGSKLPILYLIDSILKNVGGKYIEHFQRSIVSVFVETFKKVKSLLARYQKIN